jgi:hypothetical protein
MTTALVLGGAACLQEDLDAYSGPIDAVVACNDAGAIWPRHLDAWVTLHPYYWLSKGWLAAREQAGFSPAAKLIASSPKDVAKMRSQDGLDITTSDWLFPGTDEASKDASMTSGIYAAKVALVDLGHDRAVLCGIPLSPIPHFFDVMPWKSADRYAKRLPRIPAEFRSRIRSMSGFTRGFFGAP